MLLRDLARGRPSRRAPTSAPQDEVNGDAALVLRARETNSDLILRRPPSRAAVSKDGRLRMPLTLAAFALALHTSGTVCAAESDLIEQGRDLYADTCAMCHGRDMVNAGGIAFDLRKFPKDDFARFGNSVLNGKGEAMPAWRDKIDDNDLAALWAYVRSGG
jgi:mono/diheme cytochrome c family protein